MKINEKFADSLTAQRYYDNRYLEGYQYKSEPDKLHKIYDVFKNLDLPETGVALDFGCGSGAYTAFLQDLLPHWTIYGADISKIALSTAKLRTPSALFELIDVIKNKNSCFDLIFSHHVLEHVQNIEETFQMFSKILKPTSFMVHILPCGNANSFEHFICSMKSDAIEKNNGNRFFYEDPSHLRRLTSDELNQLASTIDYTSIQESYSTQYHGAIQWISLASYAFRNEFFSLQNVNGLQNKLIILKYRFIVEVASLFNNIISCYDSPAYSTKKKIFKNILKYSLLKNILSKFTTFKKANDEWENNSKAKNGSEMYMVYTRKV